MQRSYPTLEHHLSRLVTVVGDPHTWCHGGRLNFVATQNGRHHWITQAHAIVRAEVNIIVYAHLASGYTCYPVPTDGRMKGGIVCTCLLYTSGKVELYEPIVIQLFCHRL